MSFFDDFIYQLKKKKFVNFFSYFAKILSDKINYQIFKNSIRNGQYKVSKKIYKILSNKKLKSNIKERFFVSKVVFFELQLYLKVNFIDVLGDKEFQKFKKIIKKVNDKNIVLNKYKKSKYLNLTSKILNEFYYCDCLVPNINEYYNFELNLNAKNYEKKIEVITINNWWFQAIGHIFLFDTLLKGIKLKILKIKKICFQVDKEKISNKYFYKKYVRYVKKNQLYQKKPSTKNINLNLRFWYIHKFNKSMQSENIHEYIQYLWRLNSKKKLHLLDDEIIYDLNKFEKNFGSPKNTISIHIRQDGFHFSNDNAKVRNSNIIQTLEIIDKIQSDFRFILLGNPNMSLKGKKFSNILNYARSDFRSEINDFLLINYCAGHIGTTSGPSHQMLATKVPTLYINWYPFDLSSKNDLCILVPKILKNINSDEYFTLNNLGTIKPRILYDGIIRSKNIFTFQDNSNDEIDHAVRNFLNSLKLKKWKNYGKKFSIQKKNYDFHGIPNDLNKKVLDKRRLVYFDPYFAKKYIKNYLK